MTVLQVEISQVKRQVSNFLGAMRYSQVSRELIPAIRILLRWEAEILIILMEWPNWALLDVTSQLRCHLVLLLWMHLWL